MVIDSTRRTKKRNLVKTIAALTALAALSVGAHAESKTEPLDTKLGTIVGIQDGNVKVFRDGETVEGGGRYII